MDNSEFEFINGCCQIDFTMQSAALVKIKTDGLKRQIILGRQRNFKILNIEADPSKVDLKPRYAFPLTKMRTVILIAYITNT